MGSFFAKSASTQVPASTTSQTVINKTTPSQPAPVTPPAPAPVVPVTRPEQVPLIPRPPPLPAPTVPASTAAPAPAPVTVPAAPVPSTTTTSTAATSCQTALDARVQNDLLVFQQLGQALGKLAYANATTSDEIEVCKAIPDTESQIVPNCLQLQWQLSGCSTQLPTTHPWSGGNKVWSQIKAEMGQFGAAPASDPRFNVCKIQFAN